jgi:predicted nicotinamide N-methyase
LIGSSSRLDDDFMSSRSRRSRHRSSYVIGHRSSRISHRSPVIDQSRIAHLFSLEIDKSAIKSAAKQNQPQESRTRNCRIQMESNVEMKPAGPSPTAKAFFDALDSKSANRKQSATLKRRSQSLGWRNRFSQEEFYPVSMTLTDEQSTTINFSVQQVQRGELENTYGTGATVWPAAHVLVKYLEKNPNLVQNKRVVDLGSGTGVTSVACALLGASHVTCTDGEDTVVQLATDNILHAAKEIHDSSTVNSDNPKAIIHNCPIHVQKLWWGKDTVDGDCDVILVADCVLPKLYPIAPLVQAIDELLKATPNAVAVLSYEHRHYQDYHPKEKFIELAQERGLTVDTISADKLDPVYCVDDIEIWHTYRDASA